MYGFLCPPIFGALTALTSPISHPFRTSPALLKAFSEMNSLINGEAKAFTCRFEDSRILWTKLKQKQHFPQIFQ